ncbi:hypothetical protein EVAR_26637_1 [Eumeta japonica]|uniref:Uncharacterized protein n=1 Tax=Eumeta variegata TaxID=151549 RepID=A0A4C1VP61_EUMVA|nr:hypothetical protein EVAR_26637_1 [Eumeta japonica]
MRGEEAESSEGDRNEITGPRRPARPRLTSLRGARGTLSLLTYSFDFGAARLDSCELRKVVPYTCTLSERSAELHGRTRLWSINDGVTKGEGAGEDEGGPLGGARHARRPPATGTPTLFD